MDPETLLILLAAGVFLAAVGVMLRARSRNREKRDRGRLAAAEAAGLHQPVSLHPVFDPDLCIGSLVCISVCPEQDVLGVVNGVGALVVGANCVGHGRCATQCPTHAITLVFGTAQRGVDIPRLTSDFESTIPGIYVTGELGGMGLIRNAFRQSLTAVRHMAGNLAREGGDDADDLIIVGAGPAGFAAALAAQAAHLRHRVIEQDSFGGTVAHYPRQKLVLTESIDLPLAGPVPPGEIAKEGLITRWMEVRERFSLPVQEGERVEDIQGSDGRFVVTTNRGSYRTRKVLLAIGRRGTPRRLGIPGEELPTVTYRLIEPEQYVNRRVLVVGGGNSAVEAACALAGVGAEVVLSYRGAALDRCTPANREDLARAGAGGRLRVMLETVPLRFETGWAVLASRAAGKDGEEQKLPAEFVFVCAGGELPTALLGRVGLTVDRHYGASL